MSCAVVAGGLSLATGVGVAGSAKQPAIGTFSCDVSGLGKLSPQLTLNGKQGGGKLSFQVKSTHCSGSVFSGGVYVDIPSVVITGSASWSPPAGGSGSACTTLSSNVITSAKAKYVYTSTPAIAPSKLQTSGGLAWLPTAPGFTFTPGYGSTVTPTVTGSFAGESPNAFYLFTDIPNICSSTWGPVHTFLITGGTVGLG